MRNPQTATQIQNRLGLIAYDEVLAQTDTGLLFHALRLLKGDTAQEVKQRRIAISTTAKKLRVLENRKADICENLPIFAVNFHNSI